MNGEILPNGIYQEPSQKFVFEKFGKIDKLIRMFCSAFDLSRDKLQVNTETLRDIIIRMDER